MSAQISWWRSYVAAEQKKALDSPIPVELQFLGGELDSQIFTTKFHTWPPPERFYAGDIQPGAVGSYLLTEQKGETFVYSCRMDDDYMRLRNHKLRSMISRARERLSQSSKPRP